MYKPLWFLALLCILAACSQGSSNVVPVTQQPAHRHVNAQLVIKVPPCSRRHCHAERRGHYVSPSTASLAYSIDGTVQTPVTISAGSSNCVSEGLFLTCTINLVLAPGSHTFSFTAKDVNGNTLSANTDVVSKIVAGAANRIAVTLGGIATSFLVSPPTGPNVTGNQYLGFTVYGNSPLKFTIVALDADNDYIVGPGAPQPFVQATPASMTYSPPPSSAPNTFTLSSTYSSTDPRVSVASSLTVEATPVPSSGGTTVTSKIPLTLYQPWLYVADNTSNGVFAFDERGNAKTLPAPIADSNGPSGITYDPHDGFIYVTSAYSPSVHAYDPLGHAQTLTGSFSGLSQPEGIVFDPTNNELYIADDTNSAVKVYDEQGNAVSLGPQAFASPAPVHPYAIERDPNTDWFYVASCTTNIVKVYDKSGTTQTLTPTNTAFPNLNHPDGMSFDPHNDWFYVNNCASYGSNNSSMTAYDEQGNQQTLAGNPSGWNTGWDAFYDPYDGLIYVDHDQGTDPLLVHAFNEQGQPVSLPGSFTGLSWPAFITVVP